MKTYHAVSNPEREELFCTSWSGGKDACFAHWLAIKTGAKPACLVTMLKNREEQTSAHGLSREVLEAQAECVGVPIIFGRAGFGEYEEGIKNTLKHAQQEYAASSLVLGDIDLQAHRDWYEAILAKTGIRPRFPLWQYPRQQLLQDMFSVGVETMIVSVKEDKLPQRFLGEILTPKLADLIAKEGVCPTGEDGEFHTLVLDAPVFCKKLAIREIDVDVDNWGYTVLKVSCR